MTTALPDSTFEWQQWGDLAPPPPPSYDAQVLARGPLAYWRMDDAPGSAVMLDHSGNGRHGTYVNNPTLGEPSLVPTLAGDSSAASFDRPSSPWPEGQIANTQTWSDTPAFTVAGWYTVRDFGTSTGRLMYARDTGPAYLMIRTRSGGMIQFRLDTDTQPVVEIAAVAPAAGHFAAVYDGAMMRLYFNGAEVAAAAQSGRPSLVASNSVIRVGPAFWGKLDEIAHYGYAFTAEEVAADYAAGADTTAPGPSGEGWTPHPGRSAGLRSLAVSYGARDAVTRPDPLRAAVELAADLAGPPPSVGERFRLALSEAAGAVLGLAGDDLALFTGEVTDPALDPGAGVQRVTAAGSLGRTGRRRLSIRDWPVEDDGARVSRILAAAGIPAGTVDAGTVDLVDPDGDNTAATLLNLVAESTGGRLVEQPPGTVDYHSADHRRGAAVAVTLTAGQVDSRLTWEQHVDDVQNTVTVSWAGGEVTARHAASVAARGEFDAQRSTLLTTESDAHSLGQLAVARYGDPTWQLPELTVDLLRTITTDAQRAALLGLRHGDRIEVTGIPGGHPYTGDVAFFVEGWAMTLTRPLGPRGRWHWHMRLAVSDTTLSGVALRWVDVPAATSWADVPAGRTWLDAARYETAADLTTP